MMACGHGASANPYKGLGRNESFQSRVNAAIRILFNLSPIRKALLAIPAFTDIPDISELDLDKLVGSPPPGTAVGKGSKQIHLAGLALRYGVLMALRTFYSPHDSTRHLGPLGGLYSMEAFVEDLEDILQYLLMIVAESFEGIKKLAGEYESIENLAKIREKSIFYTSEESPVSYIKDSSHYFFRFRVGTPDVKNIYESFADRCCERSIMYNEYFDGTQDCEVRNKISFSLPEVLLIRLHRDEVDEDNVTSNVIPYEFYEEIDLTKFSGDKSKYDSIKKDVVRQLYTLFAVVGERKDTVRGKCSYPVFICFGQKWSKYEDDEVNITTKDEAIKGNYGTKANGSLAHVLVYIKSSSIDKIFQALDVEDIPRHVQKQLKVLARKEKAERRVPTYKSVTLLTEDTFRENEGLNLFQEPGPLPSLHVPIPHSKLVEVRVGVGLSRFYEIVAYVLNWEVNRLRIWVLHKCNTRENVFRPMLLSKQFLSSDTFKNRIQDEEFMFVEHYSYDPIPKFNVHNDSLIFLKEFDGKSLLYMGCLYVPWEMTLENLFREILGPNGLQKRGHKVRVYHEIGGKDDINDLVKQIEDWSQTVVEALAADESSGEILIIDWTNSNEDVDGTNSEAEKLCACCCTDKHVDAANHVRFLKYRRTVEFVNYDQPKERNALDINTRICCGSIPTLLEERLGLDTKGIRFFACSAGGDPERVIHHEGSHECEKLSKFLPSDKDYTYGTEFKILYRLKPKVIPNNGPICNGNGEEASTSSC